MKKIAYKTLGCKVNQYETFAIVEEFRKKGYEVVGFEESADIYIINTCAVTSMAEKKSRQMIRRVAGKGYTVVTGCGVDANPLSYYSIKGVDLVVGNKDKDKIFSLSVNGERGVFVDNSWYREYTYFNSPSYTERVRAYIKVQDGCNRFCAYCKIPYLRGEERSRDPEDIFKEVRLLYKNRIKEINLIGINLGTYNFNGYRLSDLIRDLEYMDEKFWIRLSSIEIEDVGPLFLNIKSANKLTPHLHIPLQSGDDYILTLMHRGYTREFYKDLIYKIKEINPDISLTTDVIVGFPNEKEVHFKNTYRLLEELEFYKFHIFPYSKRKGTIAYYMKDDIPKNVKMERVNILKQLRTLLMERYHKKFLGRKIEVLVEGKQNGKTYGMSPYYFKVYLDEDLPIGKRVIVSIEKIYKDGVYGEIYYKGGKGMEIYFQGEIKKMEFSHKVKVKELYKKLGISQEEYLLLKDGKLITHDKYLDPDDKIRIVKVVSGG